MESCLPKTSPPNAFEDVESGETCLEKDIQNSKNDDDDDDDGYEKKQLKHTTNNNDNKTCLEKHIPMLIITVMLATMVMIKIC